MGTLREFLDIADKIVVKQFDQTGHISPMYHIVDDDGRDMVMAAPPLDKDTMVKLMRVYLANLKAKRYLYIDEAWLATGKGVHDHAAHSSLEHFPGRSEVVMYCAEDQNEPMILASREIIREPNAKPCLGPLDIWPFDRSEGRMVGLLIPRERTVQ